MPGSSRFLCESTFRGQIEFKRGKSIVAYPVHSASSALMSDVLAGPETVGENTATEGAYDPSGMTVEDFFHKSFGQWKSQRSSHNLAWTQFEAVTSDITIVEKPADDPHVVDLCESNNVEPADVLVSIEMSWKGESDWDSDEVVEGCTLMSVVKDSETSGRLLRSAGYAETIPAVGKWTMTPEGSFVLHTMYDAAAAEERIWFATPDLRLRVSNIRTSSGRGVVTASFSSEIRTSIS
jgi:phycoerythrin-associated linker protein